MTGPVLETENGDGTRLDTHVRGYHHIAGADGGDIWAVHGHYIAHVVDGAITELTLRLFYQEGNLAATADRPQWTIRAASRAVRATARAAR
ncbi:hypothetical protein EV193_101436 [Herbihabitans rhizosphaerae]|uniref:SnoaL-like protein n=2 Tax=Herbihabitans rhizosphaerae TaxID=1872711 RepID=A0A4Q7L6R8_9PSEU|nr:hypothetical protein EV193_101436 [Herbihabitans rhizosphaerae]